jgi:predicted TIM-barrel fold metal-dependent hydrolase
MYNIHTHTFTSQHVPDGFLPLNLIKIIRKKSVAKFLTYILKFILPHTSNDALERAAVFLGVGNMDSQSEILTYIQRNYPRGTKIVSLAVDFEHMCAGDAPIGYLDQLAELREMKRDPDFSEILIPFIGADPRRDGLTDLVIDHIENHGFGGIKLYPPLGFFPFDERFDEMYRYAEEREIPVLAHCTRGGVYSRCKITADMRKHPITNKKLPGKSNADFTDNYAHPANYQHVLEKYPKLKICLAHFGGGDQWYKYLRDPWPAEDTKESWLSIIMKLIRDYPNVYTDISYTAYDKDLLPFLKVLVNMPKLRQKILYGSDIYMVQLKETEREFSIYLRGYLGEEDFKQIAVTNPAEFLEFKPPKPESTGNDDQ